MNSLFPNFVRRRFLSHAGSVTLSAGAIALLGGREALAADGPVDPKADTGILNVALGLEHQGIAAYTLGAKSGLLAKATLEVAVKFQDDHKVHRDALAATITKLGGKPVIEKSLEEYARALKAETLKNEADVLRLAASLELGATNAYLSVVPAFKDGALAQVAARLAADETAHWAILNKVLGGPLPKAMFFGS